MFLKKIGCLIVLFCSLLGQNSSLLQRVRGTVDRIKPFKVNFVQQVIIDGEMEIEESGEILFQDISRLKWTYKDPEYKVFIMEGNAYRFYDRENNQLIVGKVTKNNQKWIWQLLFSDEIVRDIQLDEKKKVIYFIDEKEELNIKIIIGRDHLLPVKAIQVDPSGVRYVYFFTDYQKGVKITRKDFELDTPADVEIIDGNLD